MAVEPTLPALPLRHPFAAALAAIALLLATGCATTQRGATAAAAGPGVPDPPSLETSETAPAATTPRPQQSELGRLAERYVDAWYGPAERRAAVAARGEDLATAAAGAAELEGALGALALPTDPGDRLRHSFLLQQTRAMAARASHLLGTRRPFDEESRLLYGVVAPRHGAAHYEALIARIEPSLPAGEGGLAARFEAYRKRFVIPPEKLDTVFRAAVAACRERTVARLPLPAGERFTIEYVTGKPWSGYNWYQGNATSVIQVNTDLPIYIDRAIDLACHEGYPGHHVYNVLHEQRLVRERGWLEHQVQPLFAPTGLVMEGSANHGIEMAFTPAERLAFERETLFPLAGLDPATAEEYYEVLGISQHLAAAAVEAARRYVDGEIGADAAVDAMVRYGFYSPERARQRIAFIDKYRSYVLNYTVGEELVAAWLDHRQRVGGGSREARWAAFAELLSEPLGPAELLAELPADAPGAPGRVAGAAAATAGAAASAAATAGQPAGVAFLVRHGEKEAGDDPVLSAAGAQRAERLAELLAAEGIGRILVTDTRRARATAAPLAARLGITPEVYDPKRLDVLAGEIRRGGGRVLVVGHSNTTGVLAGELGGDPGTAIADDEYDRLYRVELPSGATTLRRY
jgi:phosphohistidine phosphatase SixA